MFSVLVSYYKDLLKRWSTIAVLLIFLIIEASVYKTWHHWESGVFQYKTDDKVLTPLMELKLYKWYNSTSYYEPEFTYKRECDPNETF